MSKKLVFLSLVTGLTACGSGSREMTVAEFTQKISQNECVSVAPACGVIETDCLSTRQAYWSQVASDAMAKGRPFDPSRADECLTEAKHLYEALNEGMAISADAYRKEKKACDHVFHGPSTEYEACTESFDCADHQMICDKGGCGMPTEVGAGKQCRNIGEYCSQGFMCAPVGPTQQCVARSNKGAACTTDDSCLESLRCAGGVCVDGLPDSSPCQADSDCAHGFCDPFGHKCGLNIRFAENSPACNPFQSTGVVVPSSGDAGAVSPASGDAGVD